MPRVIVPALLFASLSWAQVIGSVTGVVVDRVTGAAVPGVVVTIYTRQAILYEATSDASGNIPSVLVCNSPSRNLRMSKGPNSSFGSVKRVSK